MSGNQIDYSKLRERELRDSVLRGLKAGAGAGLPKVASTMWTADGGFEARPDLVKGTNLDALARDFGGKTLTSEMIQKLKAQENDDMLARNRPGVAVRSHGYTKKRWDAEIGWGSPPAEYKR
ncbi:MAG: hypothetical protein AAGB32_00875 [Pseudomonadota bacterium]